METSTVSATASAKERCRRCFGLCLVAGELTDCDRSSRCAALDVTASASLRSTSASTPCADCRLSSSALFSITFLNMVVFWNGIRNPTHTSHRSLSFVTPSGRRSGGNSLTSQRLSTRK